MTTPEHDPDGGPTDFERRIGAWRPAPVGVDRDRMMYEAGRASARGDARIRLLAASFAASTLLTLGLGVQLARERSRCEILARSLAVLERRNLPSPPEDRPEAEPEVEVAADSYLALTRRGLDDPPASRPPAGADPADPGPTPPPLRAWNPRGLREL